MFTRRSWIGITVLIVVLVVLAALSGSSANPFSSAVSKVGMQNASVKVTSEEPLVKYATSTLQFHDGCVSHLVDVSVPQDGTYVPEMLELTGPVNVTLTQEADGLSPYSINVVAYYPFQVIVDDYRLRVAYKSDTYWSHPQGDDPYEQITFEPWQLLYRDSVRFDVSGPFKVFVWPEFGIKEGVKIQLEVCP